MHMAHLLDSQSCPAPAHTVYKVAHSAPQTLYASGLGPGEYVEVEVLTGDNPTDPGAWTPIRTGGLGMRLTHDNNWLTLPGPGVFRVSLPAALGPVTVVAY